MNLTFLIPVKIESEDRVRNLTTVLTYLLKKFDAKILVQEHDKVQRFNDLILPIFLNQIILNILLIFKQITTSIKLKYLMIFY